jgi:hypothetical protein
MYSGPSHTEGGFATKTIPPSLYLDFYVGVDTWRIIHHAPLDTTTGVEKEKKEKRKELRLHGLVNVKIKQRAFMCQQTEESYTRPGYSRRLTV